MNSIHIKIFLQKQYNTPNFFAHLSPVVPIRKNKIIERGIKFFFKKENDLQTMRSVSEMVQPAYKMMRIINGSYAQLKKRF